MTSLCADTSDFHTILLDCTMTVDISSLKKVKNSVIGNPIAKLQLSKDVNFIKSYVLPSMFFPLTDDVIPG